MTRQTLNLQYQIHRGSHEIGGSCIEITAGNTRIILDVGFPLFDRKRQPLDGRAFQKAGIAALRAAEILPDAPGLFLDDPRPAPDAVIITHPHQDHYGLIAHVKPGVPIYIGQAAARLVAISEIFLPHAAQPPTAFRTYTSARPLQFGPITLTPYLVDHSAFDAHAFLLEANGTRLLYSGDFRRHGRKMATIDQLARKARGVDVMLMEGTTLSRDPHEAKGTLHSEDDVEKRLTGEFRKTGGLAMVYASAQNIDRIVSVYRAAVKSDRVLVVDVYAATILNAVAETSPKIPHPKKFPLRVVYPRLTTDPLFKKGREKIAYAVHHAKIRWGEIGQAPEKYVLLVRPSMREIGRMALGAEPLLVYSQWGGYKRETSTQRFLESITSRNGRVIDVHVSGHAYPDALRDFHRAVAPKKLVPIHTLVPERYSELFGGE